MYGTDWAGQRELPMRFLLYRALLSAALTLVNGMLMAPWWILQGRFEPPWQLFG